MEAVVFWWAVLATGVAVVAIGCLMVTSVDSERLDRLDRLERELRQARREERYWRRVACGLEDGPRLDDTLPRRES
jgi:hypothetical protein